MKGLTIRDLLFWAMMERGYAKDDRIRAVWEQIVRRVRECVETYYKPKGGDRGPRRPDSAGAGPRG